MIFADSVAQQLIPLSSKANSFKHENVVISDYFMWQGFLTYNIDESIKAYKEALEWYPYNNNAKELLAKLIDEEEKVDDENGYDDGEEEMDDENNDDEKYYDSDYDW